MDWTDPNTDVFGFQTNQNLMPSSNDSGTFSGSWLDSVTGVLGSAANAYATIKAADAIKSQQVAPNGMLYTNGQFNPQGEISPTVLLIGAAVLLFVFINK